MRCHQRRKALTMFIDGNSYNTDRLSSFLGKFKMGWDFHNSSKRWFAIKLETAFWGNIGDFKFPTGQTLVSSKIWAGSSFEGWVMFTGVCKCTNTNEEKLCGAVPLTDWADNGKSWGASSGNSLWATFAWFWFQPSKARRFSKNGLGLWALSIVSVNTYFGDIFKNT